MQLPDSVQNILAYGQGYKDGMKDGHICGFHDALVGAVHDLTTLLQKYHELEVEYAGLQEKAMKERLENMPQLEQPPEQKHGRWIRNTTSGGYNCSNCGYHVNIPIGEMIDPRDYECYLDKYCGGCGMRMDADDL